MKCPICKDVDLVMSERQSIEIDYCPECRGVWLDRGELDKIIERSDAGPPPERREAGPRRDDDRGGYGGKRKRKSFLHELFD
ncbi:MAG: zf-TFIIB domain-containing protein [Trueperaceae bacterium]|nr:zf-TFIIB domain-containing protein [Trueperaceae bacterium]